MKYKIEPIVSCKMKMFQYLRERIDKNPSDDK